MEARLKTSASLRAFYQQHNSPVTKALLVEYRTDGDEGVRNVPGCVQVLDRPNLSHIDTSVVVLVFNSEKHRETAFNALKDLPGVIRAGKTVLEYLQ